MNTTPVIPVQPSLVVEHSAAKPPEAARHFADRLAFETDPSDLHHDLDLGLQDVVAVDTRSQVAYLASHIPGAVSLPHASITASSTGHLSKERVYVTYCWGPGCNASTKGALRLSSMGFRVKELIGGLEYWQKEGYPTKSGELP
jgi:rhodanese-related sulfurtransferase